LVQQKRLPKGEALAKKNSRLLQEVTFNLC